jgi:hypothetical protein
MDESMEFKIELIIRFFSLRILGLLLENLFLLLELMLEEAAFLSSFNKTHLEPLWNRSQVSNRYKTLLTFDEAVIKVSTSYKCL